MNIRLLLLGAALMFLLLMSGCASVNENTENNNGDAQTTAASYVPAVTDFLIPVHDLDPQAMEKHDEGLPYFRSSQCEEVTFYPSEDAVKRCGRFIEYNDIFYLSYSNSAVSFRFTGDRITAVMTSNGGVYPENQQCYVGVLVDGRLTQRIKLQAGENEYEIYNGRMLSGAEISIVKLTENQMATSGIKSITANAEMIAPVGRKDRKIEFIGDSISCGYGNEADGPSDGYKSSQQNALETFCKYTADTLDSDYSVVAISGVGLISDFTDTVGEKEDYLLMPDVYDFSDANFQLRRGITEMTEWSFGGGSDIVVINIGTNDYSYTGKREELQDEFREAYYEFIGQVRSHNPDAKIICTMGIMGAELFGCIESAAKQYSKDNDDENIFTLKFDYQDEADGYGGDYHPTPATHRKAADKLSAFIRELMREE